MKPSLILTTFILLLLALAPVAVAAESDPQALALLRKSENALRAGSSISVYRMELVRPDWHRSMRFRSHDDRKNNRFRMEILSPRKTRGTLFFKDGRKLSMYLPKLRREIHISPIMMHDPWMGSDFNNQDLLEAAALIDSYTHQIVAREGDADEQLVSIKSVPKSHASVVWDRLEQKVRADGLPVQVDYVDCKGNVLRRMSFSNIREMGGRRLPTRWVMTPMDKQGQRTEIILEEIEFDVELPDSLFERPGGTRRK